MSHGLVRDATTRLAALDVPTLVIGGSRDQCVPELSASIADAVPGAELAILDAAHLPFYERPEEYLALVRDFLGRADRST